MDLQVRSATLRLNYNGRMVLIDPYLAAKYDYDPLPELTRRHCLQALLATWTPSTTTRPRGKICGLVQGHMVSRSGSFGFLLMGR